MRHFGGVMVIFRTRNQKVGSSKLGFAQNKILIAGLWFSIINFVYEAKYTHYIHNVNSDSISKYIKPLLVNKFIYIVH